MDRPAVWGIAIPLFALAGVLALCKLYLLYVGRNTRGRHAKYAPEISVSCLNLSFKWLACSSW